MLYTLKNDRLTVQVNSRGAELFSAIGNGCEYVWQGDAKYWTGRAPMMFPICGRCYEGKYTYQGKTYEMGGHGFLIGRELEAEQISDTEVRFTLCANEETKAMYPFDFSLTVVYRLAGNTLTTSYEIKNTGDGILPVTAGGHPGFNIPLDNKGEFTDFYLEFDEECSPDEIVLAGAYRSGLKRGVALEGGKILRLNHSLFDLEALFMDRMAKSVTLKSDKTDRFVKLCYDDMTYLGVWQPAHTDAPFVCIEPWCGFPAFDGVTDDFATKADMFRLQPGSQKMVSYSITFG